MEKKNKGFIATSLIYSFFLAFVALIAALLSNYIANKTILDRFNGEVAKSLNTNRYYVTIYSRNANIIDGFSLTNMVANGNFSSNDYWQSFGNASVSFANDRLGNFSLHKINSEGQRSYLYQQMNFVQNNKYYYSAGHLSASNDNFKTYIGSSSDGYLDTQNSNSTAWTKVSNIYEATESSIKNLIVADGSNNGEVFLTNMMVIDLTASFGKGNEPTKTWIDDNIEYFDGTLSYLKYDQIESGSPFSIEIIPFQGYDSYKVTCKNPKTDDSISNYNILDKDTSGQAVKEFKIDSVNSDIKCTIDWEELM